MVCLADQRGAELISRQRHTISGIVQGVGFRPFVYRIAHELQLSGWVRNTPAGVELEVEGSELLLAEFAGRLANDLPPLARITAHQITIIPAVNSSGFVIQASSDGNRDIQIAPDSALCPDCRREVDDPDNRRYRYPFITCTNCGPRYSIITGVPYDRPNTTMARFPLCPDCLAEYHDPLDRRFHAQPIACPACGPRLTLSDASGTVMAMAVEALTRAVSLLADGQIVAIKGLGGYHLAVDATNHDAVQRLRRRKKRDEKPFAVMAASLAVARQLASLNSTEEKLLSSPEAPIVIAGKQSASPLAPLIAPGNGWLGVMLPYTPLHHLLFSTGLPGSQAPLQALVMTSGNISDEPVAYTERDAVRQLTGIADVFLHHDRDIHIRCDDSVLRVFQGEPIFYRRSRGYTPKAVTLPCAVPPLLATGAELKNTICLANGNLAFLSQHIGDLKNQATYDTLGQTVSHLSELLAIAPQLVVCDLHPDYHSTRFAEQSGLPLIRVQHHHAHLAACMAENGLEGEVLGIILDGTGLGSDGTIWGGEFLVGGYQTVQRAGHFRTAPLPGGDAAVREPWRMALSYLHQALGDSAFTIDHPVARFLSEAERPLFAGMLRRGINSPATSSCGRLFDAAAALLNIRHIVSYDAQGAIELEALAEQAGDDQPSFPFELLTGSAAPFQLDFTPALGALLHDLQSGQPAPLLARRFHATVARGISEAAGYACRSNGVSRIVLSGGVFQNRLLSEMVYTALTRQNFTVYCHRLVPPNDGGIAMGQAALAARKEV